MKNIKDYDAIKNKIVPYLSIKDYPFALQRLYLDLNVYYVIRQEDCDVLIEKDDLSMWDGITEYDIYKQAKENIKHYFSVLNMSDIFPLLENDYMKIVCLPDKKYGSSALLFPEIFEGIKNGEPLTLLPSSIHEILVISEFYDTQATVKMIMEINRTSLKDNEILNNHPYRYADGKITEV